MTAGRLRLQVEGAIQVVVAALVVWTALAVSHVDVLNIPVARAVRWGILAVLVGVALLYALTARPDRRALPLGVVGAGLALCALATLSALWSASPLLTLGRALTLGVLLVAAASLGVGTRGESEAVGQILLGLLAGTTLVALGGLLALVLGDDRAYVPATTGIPTRYNGLGGNPNTMALLLAATLPLAGWALLVARSRGGKAAAAAIFLVLQGSIVASGSRGAIAAAFVGLLPLALAVPRQRRPAVVGGAVALLLVSVAVTQILPHAERDPVLNPEFGGALPLSEADAQFILPLENEIGFELSRTRRLRGLLDTSGRTEAWRGGLEQAAQRPLLGYGFGTEERVFVDRFYLFLADRVENSYLGTALQLGVVGLALLLVLLAAVGRAAVRAVSAAEDDGRAVAAACSGVVLAAAVLAVTQSFLTSVGSPATAPTWLCALLLAALAARTTQQRPGARDRERHE
jgi:exopolysaccharide production protein ExoQ